MPLYACTLHIPTSRFVFSVGPSLILNEVIDVILDRIVNWLTADRCTLELYVDATEVSHYICHLVAGPILLRDDQVCDV